MSGLSVFVTVGMGPWPFDRLVGALDPVCARHDVFVQTGTSALVPPCEHAPFIGWAETQRRLAEADVVVTHAGNTVRLVQRLGKVPIAIAREAGLGEMRNDHQVRYLDRERHLGRVVALDGDLAGLAAAVDDHPAVERAMLAVAPPLARLDGDELARLLDQVRDALSGGNRIGERPGRHLDLTRPGADMAADGAAQTMSLAWPAGRALLPEARRVLASDGLLLVAVRARHRAELLAALTAAGFQPRWTDGGTVGAVPSADG